MNKVFCGNEMDKMPGWAFRVMAFMFNVTDLFKPAEKKLLPFNIRKGSTVVDYGCGTGRYVKKASELDMFHMVRNTFIFLQELKRISKRDGILIIEDGHQPRALAREKVNNSGCWVIISETKAYMKCKPINQTL